jgi:hypothetical protein
MAGEFYTGHWSFSGWEQYNQCPFKFKCRHLLHLPDPPGPQAARGTRLHQTAQDFIEAKRDDLTEEFYHLRPFYRELRDVHALCELEWGFLRDWTPCAYEHPRVWIKVKTDAIYSPAPAKLVVVDHKSGKIYEDKHEMQTELYAVAAFILHPNAEEVKTILAYIDKNHKQSRIYLRAVLQALIARWEARVKPLYLEDLWPMRANEYCGNCNYRKANGGPCQY